MSVLLVYDCHVQWLEILVIIAIVPSTNFILNITERLFTSNFSVKTVTVRGCKLKKMATPQKSLLWHFLASLASAKALSSYINACAKSNTLGSHMARNMFAQSTCRHSTVAMKWVPKHQACSHLAFSRERLRRVLRKKAAVVIHLQIYILTPSHLQIYIFTPSHLQIFSLSLPFSRSSFYLSLKAPPECHETWQAQHFVHIGRPKPR